MADKINTWIKFIINSFPGISIITPPTNAPIGIVIKPAIIPLAYWGKSSFKIFIAIGVVKDIVAPIEDDNINPEKCPIASLFITFIAEVYPPISGANILAINTEGSTPVALDIDERIGINLSAITGDKQYIPSIVKTKLPIASIPS